MPQQYQANFLVLFRYAIVQACPPASKKMVAKFKELVKDVDDAPWTWKKDSPTVGDDDEPWITTLELSNVNVSDSPIHP